MKIAAVPIALTLLLSLGVHAVAAQQMLVIVGAPGNEEYGSLFSTWADRLQEAAGQGGVAYAEIGRAESSGESNDRTQLQQWLESADRDGDPLWVIWIGHGTSYRDATKFNLRGPDVSAKEFSIWLAPIERQLVLVNCSSSSGPFIQELSAPNRIILTATRSGSEQNFARFGEYFSAAITDLESDLDHDDEVSVLEAFLSAVGSVEKYYAQDARLMTEHALLEDNGDKLGVTADFYRGARPVRAAKDNVEVDGRLAARTILIRNRDREPLSEEDQQERDRLEQDIEQLRERKSRLAEDAYYDQLESLLVPLSRLMN